MANKDKKTIKCIMSGCNNMVISHNLMAMNIFNNLNRANYNKARAMERLSSGYRINRAGDDAAGLAISEKMRAQIRGLQQASKNAQDGISLLQAAEGGMSEINNILQRCRELSVQSANDTYTDDDRANLQLEVSELIKEVDSIAKYTEFNDKALLSGQYDKDGNYVASASLDDYLQYITTSGGLTDTYTYGTNSYASALIDFSNITSAADVANLIGKGISYTCCTCDKTYSIKFVNGTPDTSRLNDSNPVMEVDVSSITNGTDLVNKIMETAYGQTGFVYDPTSNSGIPTIGLEVPAGATSFVTHYSQLAADNNKLYIYDDRTSEYGLSWPSGENGVFNLSVYGEDNTVDLFSYYNIQVGSNAGQNIKLQISNMTADQLGIKDLSIASRDGAESAITKFDDAIKLVSGARSKVGSYQNRLEFAVEAANNTAENLQSAESRIRDADIAEEMVKFSKYNMLEQVAESLLAQVNKLPNIILELLK